MNEAHLLCNHLYLNLKKKKTTRKSVITWISMVIPSHCTDRLILIDLINCILKSDMETFSSFPLAFNSCITITDIG